MEELSGIAALLSARGQLCSVLTSSFVNVNTGKVPALQGCDGELGSRHNALVSSSYYPGP